MNANDLNQENEKPKKKITSRVALRVYAYVSQVIVVFVVFPFLGYFIGTHIDETSETRILCLIVGLLLAIATNIMFTFQFLRNEARYEKYNKRKEN